MGTVLQSKIKGSHKSDKHFSYWYIDKHNSREREQFGSYDQLVQNVMNSDVICENLSCAPLLQTCNDRDLTLKANVGFPHTACMPAIAVATHQR